MYQNLYENLTLLGNINNVEEFIWEFDIAGGNTNKVEESKWEFDIAGRGGGHDGSCLSAVWQFDCDSGQHNYCIADGRIIGKVVSEGGGDE